MVHGQGPHLPAMPGEHPVGVGEGGAVLEDEVDDVWTREEGAEVAGVGGVETEGLPAVLDALGEIGLGAEEHVTDPERQLGL